MNITDATKHIEAARATTDYAARLGHLVGASEVIKAAITETKKKLAVPGEQAPVDEVGTPPLPGMDVTVNGSGVVETPSDHAPFSERAELPDEEALAAIEAAARE